MKLSDREQLDQAADRLGDVTRRWKLLDGRGEFLVLRIPEGKPLLSSPEDGEPMQVWRFNVRIVAERFRNRMILAEIAGS